MMQVKNTEVKKSEEEGGSEIKTWRVFIVAFKDNICGKIWRFNIINEYFLRFVKESVT